MPNLNKVMLVACAVGMYQDGNLSLTDISQQVDIPVSSVRKLILSAGLPLRSRVEGIRAASQKLSLTRTGKRRKPFSDSHKSNIRSARLRHAERHAKGTRVTPKGYIEFTRGPHKGRLQHDVVIEEQIGRRITKGEHVHHKDENRQNNTPSNLQLLTISQHMKHHTNQRRIRG